jgi:hypothetical protein
MASIPDADLDSVILSVSRTQWQKVAMIIARVMQSYERNGVKVGEIPITKRVRKLVAEGKLHSQGNLSRVRYSEVKLPD